MKKVFLSLITVFMVLSLSVVLVKASEATTVELVDGVQIRTDGNNGLRWQANVSNAAENQTYGFLFAQGEVEDLTVATAGVVNQEITELKEDGSFAATMAKFPKAAVANDISVRAYVKNGNEYTYSENIVVRNLAEVALGAKNKGVEGEFVESVIEYVNENYKKAYVNKEDTLFINSAIYETVPTNLEKVFVADWNAKFGTNMTVFDNVVWAESATDGSKPMTDDTDTDCSGTNAYEFFITDTVTSAKWGWLLTFFLNETDTKDHPARQINALLNGGTYNDEHSNVLYQFAHLSRSLENFFDGNGGSVGKNIDIIIEDLNVYAKIEQYNTSVYAVEPKLVKQGADFVLPAAVLEGYELDGYTDGTNTFVETYAVGAESIILTPVFSVHVPTPEYVITKSNATTPGYYVDYRASYTFVDALDNGVFVSNNKGKGSSGAYMDVFFTDNGTFTFTYKVSSESRYDKLNVYAQANGNAYQQILTGISGEATDTVTLTVEAGDYIYFQYIKDSSGNSGDDTVTLSNLVFVTDEFYTKSVLSFNTDGGNEIEAVEVYDNAKVDKPVDPVKNGYFFDGWYTDIELENAFDFAAGINGDTTLYAKYTKGVNVSFANTGDAAVEAVLVRPNAAITEPSVVPTKADQYFNGWYADEDCTTAFDFAAGVAVDTVVYAGWRNPITLSFDSKDGSAVEDIQTDVNVAITLPAAPTKEGYVFDAWYTDESYIIKFNGENGISESTTVYAKWLKELTITYKYNEEVIGTDDAVEGDLYSVVVPENFTELVLGWYTDSALTNEFVDGTVLATDLVLYAKVESFAPAGVLSSMVNGAESSYEWAYDSEKGTFTSGNKEKGNSKAILEFTFAKESFTAFSYLVNSESNYDYLTIYVNGTEVYKSKVSGLNGKDITGSFSQTFKAGDVLKIQYQKDGSGNQGLDCAILSNFVINDGVPAANITFKYQDEGVQDRVLDANLNDVVVNVEGFATYAPADSEARKFGGWYYDAECTKPLGEADLITSSIVLYAKYLYPVTISFDINGDGEANEIDAIQVWTGISIVDAMPENPTIHGYIFRYWLDEEAEQFDPANGVTNDIMLTAYFEELPVGSTKDVALEVEFVNGSFVSETLETDEEFQNFYFKLTPTTTDYFYFKFPQDGVTVVGSTVSYSGPNYRRYMVEDADGNTVLGKESSDRKVLLEAGVTYYAIYNLGYNTNTQWGTFKAEIHTYTNDSANEAIDYEFNTQITTELGAFKSSSHTVVYKYVAETSGTYALKASSNAWAKVTVYSDELLSSQVAYSQVYDTTKVADLTVEAGQTYYVVLSQNWSGSSLANNTMSFVISEYPQGYVANNPLAYALGETINAEFANGNTLYYQVEVQTAGTYKLSILSISDSSSKTIELYNADMSVKVAKLAGSVAGDYYVENLEAGTYVIKAFNTSSSNNTSFTASLSSVAEGLYWSTAEELVLAEDMELNANGTYYYEFVTGTDVLWHFFEATNGSVNLYDAQRNKVDLPAQLAATTSYFLVVESEEETVAVKFNTLVDYADGKSPSGAFTYNDETANLSLVQASYNTYFKLTVAETGTYRLYTNNNGSIDTKGWIYDDVACSTHLNYNDDGYQAKVNAGFTGYRYDFYMECELNAGVEYYVKITYTVPASNTATSLVFNVVNIAA